MRRLFRELKNSLMHLCYPIGCLHCEELLAPDGTFLCDACGSLLQQLEGEERCQSCFNLRSQTSTHCPYCQKRPSLYYRSAAVFPFVGPAASMVKKMKYSGRPYLAKGMGAFMAAQFVQLEWPIPDAIIPVPISFSHWLSRGYNQSALLAQELANILQVPVWPILKRSGLGISQAGLTLEQRQQLEDRQFSLKNSFPIQDKVLLVIDDVTTSGSTLQKCAETLYERCPTSLYALTFCKTELGL